ncbi:MAG: LuxR C-terminal-related transcriptional regulator [Anaerolineales bacterium]|nr:LuxR C-terminal-related transcriptional regulator [Anaerolineales bacterium]
MDFAVCLLSAPAGYGKTTLVCDWLAQANTSFAWLTLDEGDNESHRFLSYLAAAIGNALPKSAERFAAPLPVARRAAVEAYLAALINKVAESQEHLTLVLNNGEAITNGLCHGALEYLIEYAPDNFHTLLLTRADPPLPFSRWRARGQLLELRAADLRFSRDEIRDLIAETTRQALTDEELNALDQRTQGRAASLRLLTRSLETAPNKQHFFKALEDSRNRTMDFLVDEVLKQLPAETQAFLYRTSILPQFSGDLCQALTGNPHSESILRDLERHNLFISRLDHDSRWYRFHPLFAKCLQQRLREQTDIDIADLHRRASDWHAADGNADAALNHAFEAKDFDRAARIMEAHAILWIDQGEYQTFTHWFEQLPREQLTAYPRLSAFYLCGLLDSRNLERFEAFAALQAQLETLPEVQHLIQAMRAVAALVRGDDQTALTLTNQSIPTFQVNPPQTVDEFFAYSLHLFVRMGIYYQADNVLAAEQAAAAAIPVFLQAGLAGYALDALGVRASNKMRLGNLRQAEDILEQALLLLRRSGTGSGMPSHPIAVRIYGPLSRLYYEQNRLADSIAMAQKAIESSQSGGYQWGWRVAEVYATLGLAYLASNEVAFAFDTLEKIRQIENLLAGYPSLHTRTRRDALCQKMRLLLALAPFDETLYSRVEEWRNKNQARGEKGGEAESALWARYLILQGKVAEAESVLHPLIHTAGAERRLGDLLEYLTLAADEGALRRALEMAEPQGFLRVFIDGGERVRAALEKIHLPYARKILAAFPTLPGAQKRKAATPWLNLHEREILRLLDAGYSNQQIADALHLSVNTVKWYARRIYAALGAKNRREALTKAKEWEWV